MVVALRASLILLWSPGTTWKLNMSGLDFLVLVLQNSHSFDLNAFFQVLFSLILTAYKGHIQNLFLGAVCPMRFFAVG